MENFNDRDGFELTTNLVIFYRNDSNIRSNDVRNKSILIITPKYRRVQVKSGFYTCLKTKQSTTLVLYNYYVLICISTSRFKAHSDTLLFITTNFLKI